MTNPTPARPRKVPTDHLPKATAKKKTSDANVDPDGCFVGEVSGTEIRVLPVMKWRASAIRAMKDFDLDVWATGAIHPDDVDLFIALDITLEETMKFVYSFTQWLNDQGPDAALPGLGKTWK